MLDDLGNRQPGVVEITTVPMALLAPGAGLGPGVSLMSFKVSQFAVELFGWSASAAGLNIYTQMSVFV